MILIPDFFFNTETKTQILFINKYIAHRGNQEFKIITSWVAGSHVDKEEERAG